MSRAEASPAVQVFVGVVWANALALLIWFGMGWYENRQAVHESKARQWHSPSEFVSASSSLPPGLAWRRKEVTVKRVSPVLVSDHERTLGMLQLPGYTLGDRDAKTVATDLREVLNAVDHRVRHLLWEKWVPPVIRLPQAQREADLSVVLGRDGRVVRRTFIRPSGSDALDSSIVAAAARLEEVLPLPQAYGRDEYELNVSFRVE